MVKTHSEHITTARNANNSEAPDAAAMMEKTACPFRNLSIYLEVYTCVACLCGGASFHETSTGHMHRPIALIIPIERVQVLRRETCLKDPDGDEEGKQQLVLLEQTSAHVRVHVVGEEVVELL